MAILTRKYITKVIFTLCLWMFISVIYLWTMNGIGLETSFYQKGYKINGKFGAEMKLNTRDVKAVDQIDLNDAKNNYTHKRFAENTLIALRKMNFLIYESGNEIPNTDPNIVINKNRLEVRETDDINRLLNDSNSFDTKDKTQRKKRLPQALIIGVKKCGTRALLEFLRIHPNVRAPGPEPHFFDRNFHLGWEWYREKMPPSLGDQLTIEKTPKYFVNPDVPKRVYSMSRDTKLIVVVRDPVTRAISDFTQAASKQLDLQGVTIERKAFRCNGTGPVNTHWSGINTGLYVNHIRRWLDYFPFENFHFVSGENIIKDPAQELQSIQDFLNLTSFIKHEHFKFNETKGFPCVKKDMSTSVFQCFNSRKGRSHVFVADDTVNRLRAFFKPYNREFYQLTGRDFGWS